MQPADETLTAAAADRSVVTMFDIPALDVAIGLLFLYFVLALVCSTVNEGISTALGMRARFLQLGLLNLLSADSNVTKEGQLALRKLYGHPLIQTLVRPGRGLGPRDEAVAAPAAEADPTAATRWWRKPPYPSYLPSRTFVAALTDLARDTTAWRADAAPEEVERAAERVRAATAQLEQAIASIPNTRLAEALLAVYRSAGRDAAAFQHAAEQWFDDAMERVSGWYKRRVQLFLLVIASVVVVLLNADTIAAARVLWRDDAARAAVVKQAEAAAESGAADGVDEAVSELDLPLGWNLSTGGDATDIPDDAAALLSKLVGLALTVAAILLGAPFWFDLLGKIMRVRSTGAPPPASDAVRRGEGEQSRAGSAVIPPTPPAIGARTPST